ncbi:MAG: hypothetical protein V2I35_10860 [Desulfocapsaceae bacterium]|jgi:hypothetical protein|nr:hypothetical protein [Desulfocapsaceae bacterium]
MDAVTYSTDTVISFIEKYLVPVRLTIQDDGGYGEENYQTFWTPTLGILDPTGTELQRVIGFFSPGEFIAEMHLGIAKFHFNAEDYDTALVHLNVLLEGSLECCSTPEAVYFRGVTLYKQKNDAAELKHAHEELLKNYPDSTWAKRALPYRLL